MYLLKNIKITYLKRYEKINIEEIYDMYIVMLFKIGKLEKQPYTQWQDGRLRRCAMYACIYGHMCMHANIYVKYTYIYIMENS